MLGQACWPPGLVHISLQLGPISHATALHAALQCLAATFNPGRHCSTVPRHCTASWGWQMVLMGQCG